ncbi:astacin [Ancylostoma caninum]|uniref:Metalloendopeptidase n=1 Tax=Ancylostoma caninum TaxID=29170 RepID=A0A368GB29_ANCCA|nr:astacin [Ancylostoma caninum]
MAWILVIFLCFIWSNELSRGQEVITAEQSSPETVHEDRASNLNAVSGERVKRHVAKESPYHQKWTEGVYFVYEPNATEKLKTCFFKAAHTWQKRTCVNFTEGKPEDDYGYLLVTDKYDYMSHVGRNGSEQILSIGKKCEDELGLAIREVGRVLGLQPTHNRYDRNRYISVIPGVNRSAMHEFEMIPQNESELYGTNYDYGSIMHHGSSPGKPTILPTDKNYLRTMGSHMISFTDLWLINEHYGCHGNRPLLTF